MRCMLLPQAVAAVYSQIKQSPHVPAWKERLSGSVREGANVGYVGQVRFINFPHRRPLTPPFLCPTSLWQDPSPSTWDSIGTVIGFDIYSCLLTYLLTLAVNLLLRRFLLLSPTLAYLVNGPAATSYPIVPQARQSDST